MGRGRQFGQWPKRILALGAAAVAVAALVLLTALYNHRAPVRSGHIVSLELGGRDNAATLVQRYGAAPLRSTIQWDFVFIAGYGAALLIGAGLAIWLTRQEMMRRYLPIGLALAVITILADLVENLFLLLGLGGHPKLGPADVYDAAAVAATLKFCALVPAAVLAAIGVGLALVRGMTFPRRVTVAKPAEVWPARPMDLQQVGHSNLAPDPADGASARWLRGYHLPCCTGQPRPALKDGEVTGVGLSGGGIRAASLGLGALQSPGMRSVLSHSQYLVSVSGGGYTAGALAQALAEPEPRLPRNHKVIRDPRTVFAVGSPEEDHLRRHSSYLADNAGQLIAALAQLGRHLVLTLVLLFGPAVVLGFVAGRFYRAIPITLLSLPDHRTTDQTTVHLGFRAGAGWALAMAAVFTVLCWLAGEGVAGRRRPDRDSWWHRLFAAAERLGRALCLVLLLVAVALPALIWFCSGVLHRTPAPVSVASPIGAVLLTYAAGLASVAWRKRSLLQPKDKAKPTKPGPAAGAPRGFVQVLLVIAALFVLGAGWLLIFGGIATVGLEPHLGSSTIGILVAITVLAVFLGGFTDETTLSLHPFYRARLASAFAVRRIRTPDGLAVAQPYPPAERTVLSRYGRLATPTAFPHIVFAASATVGQQSTAPGDDRVSYTMCADWIGGPDVGYVRTSALERIASPRLKRDLTVQAAVAISGAAIASSVSGQSTKWYETLMAISGLRLGAWLPNPSFVGRQYTHPRGVDRPGLPRIRRASYLLRELFGGHPAGGPLLQVTDGGFYDNLGLIELLRRGCTRIYVIDASGDTPPAAQTLGHTLIAAYQELGVVTALDRTTWSTLTPGSAAPLSPKDPLAGLSARLSAKGLITGSFRYPDSSPYLDEHGRGRTGRLVVAKASLWPELEYQMLAYAMSQAVFPHDSTADQFFDEGQYAGYTQLGRDLGQAAAAVLNQPPPPRSRWLRLRCAARSRRH